MGKLIQSWQDQQQIIHRKTKMKNQHNPMAIILKKVHNGYQFEQLRKLNDSKPHPAKKPKQQAKRGFNGRPPSNRLIKQIGLSSQQIQDQILNSSHLQEQSHTSQHVPHPDEEPQDNVQTVPHIVEEQEVSCQIQRQDLTQNQMLPKSAAKQFNPREVHPLEKLHFRRYVKWSQVESTQTQNGIDEHNEGTQDLLISEEVYMMYRNFIFEAYMKNPKRCLTKVSCRRVLRGDINIIHKIHSFLEESGMINYGLGMDGNYCFKPSPLTKEFEQKLKPQTCLKNLPQNDEETKEKEIDTDNMTLTVINKNFSRTFRAHCSLCRLVCGIVWFAGVSGDDTLQRNLCFQCFDSLEPEDERKSYQKVDIIKKMENTSKENKSIKASWNIDDNLKLLDFMSHSQNHSWKELIDQFDGKKTIEDVILQYMQFPISNFEPTQLHKQKAYKELEKQIDEDIGYKDEDYVEILTGFFKQSEYYDSATKQESQQREKEKEKEIEPSHTLNGLSNSIQMVEEKWIESPQRETGLKSLIGLMNAQMVSKMNRVSQREKLICDVEISCGELVRDFYGKTADTVGTVQEGKSNDNSESAKGSCEKSLLPVAETLDL